MNAEQLARYYEARREGLKKIAAAIDNCKVCLQCLSITFLRGAVCPFCKCYRFTQERVIIEVVLKNMCSRPWPLRVATPPRLLVEHYTPLVPQRDKGTEAHANR